jgi:dihydrofolate reductase
MAKLIYASNVSIDGYTEDERGAFDWAAGDNDVFAFITDLLRSVGTYLYGRRLYETMAVWETDAALAAQSDLMSDFANVWQAADKLVYSTTLAAVSTAKTQLERHFDPGAIHDLKGAASSDLIVGGPNLAAQAFKAGLVDECHLFIWPVVLGGRKPACRPTRAPSSSSSTSADSATASYISATALCRNPRPLRREHSGSWHWRAWSYANSAERAGSCGTSDDRHELRASGQCRPGRRGAPRITWPRSRETGTMVRVARLFHVTCSAKRESVLRHGLDWRRISAARGIAGSRTPEHDGCALCESDSRSTSTSA